MRLSEPTSDDFEFVKKRGKHKVSDIKKMRRKRNILSVDDVEDEESDAVFPTRPIFVSKAQQQKPVAVALTIDSSNIPKVKDNKASIYYNKDTIQATIIPSVSYEVPTQNQFIENQSVQSRPTPSNNYDSSYHYQHYDYNRFYPPPPPPHYGHPPPPHHGHHPPSYHGHHPRPPPYYGYYPPPPPPHHGHYPPSPPPYDSYPPPPPPPPPPSYYPPPPQTSYYYYDSGNNSDQMGNNAGKDISEKIDNIFGNHFETTTDLSSLVDIRGNK